MTRESVRFAVFAVFGMIVFVAAVAVAEASGASTPGAVVIGFATNIPLVMALNYLKREGDAGGPIGWVEERVRERVDGPYHPLIEGLGREARVGTIALIPTFAVFGLLSLLFDVGATMATAVGEAGNPAAELVMVTLLLFSLFLVFSDYVETLLVRRGVLRPRRAPSEEAIDA